MATLVDEMRPHAVLVGIEVTADSLVDVELGFLAANARLLSMLNELMHSVHSRQRDLGQVQLVSDERA